MYRRCCEPFVYFPFVALCLVATMSACRNHSDGGGSGKKRQVTIAVNQYVHHPNLDALLSGFKAVVGDWAEQNSTTVLYTAQNAAGDPSTALQIARQQAALGPDLILAMGTPAAQASRKATSETPIVFGAITDPVSADLVASLSEPGGNATGTTDLGPYDEQFKLIRRLLPNVRTVGIIRNPGEANSVASMKIIDNTIVSHGMKKVEASVANSGEVLAAAQSLVGRCDVLYMPADNTVLSALAAVVGVAQGRKLPLFVGDEGSVRMGGVATIGIDYNDLGRTTGQIAIRVLQGEPTRKIPVGFGSAARVIVNVHAAEKQGVAIPPDILNHATIVGD